MLEPAKARMKRDAMLVVPASLVTSLVTVFASSAIAPRLMGSPAVQSPLADNPDFVRMVERIVGVSGRVVDTNTRMDKLESDCKVEILAMRQQLGGIEQALARIEGKLEAIELTPRDRTR